MGKLPCTQTTEHHPRMKGSRAWVNATAASLLGTQRVCGSQARRAMHGALPPTTAERGAPGTGRQGWGGRAAGAEGGRRPSGDHVLCTDFTGHAGALQTFDETYQNVHFKRMNGMGVP